MSWADINTRVRLRRIRERIESTAPIACQIQGEHDERDLLITAQVYRTGRGLSWWWGKRNWVDTSEGPILFRGPWKGRDGMASQVQSGAWCYVCDRPVTTWPGRWPITAAALVELLAHREYHLRELARTAPARAYGES